MWLQLVGQDAASFADMQSDVEQAIQWIQQNKSNLCAQYTGGKDVPMYFGGYSSGAHVGLTVLQRPSSLSSLFQGIVLISGVLAVRPEVLSEKNHIRWLTDGILQIVFGPKDAKSIPSPIAGLIPPLPHLILGCEQEMWGLTWLNVFFCSRAYAEKARQCGIPVSYHEIVSDHWFILSHPELPKMLQRELPRLAKPSEQQ
jgi:acetyl esterase/lipase